MIFYLLHSSLHCVFLILFLFNYITISCIYLFLTPNSRSVFCAGVSLNIHSFIHSFLQNCNVQCEVSLPIGSYKYEKGDLILRNQIPELERWTVFTHSLMPVIKTVIVFRNNGTLVECLVYKLLKS